MRAEIKGLELVMFEKTEMPESLMKKDENGKTVFEKTGKKVEFTTYSLRDFEGNVLKFVAGNDFRALERKKVDIEIDVIYDDFSRKTKVKLTRILPSEQK